MALTNAFYEAVQSGNVRRVRIMMEDSLLVDLTFADFNAMEKAASSMPGLYDEHDGKELVQDRSLWTDDYMNQMMVQVLFNFSHERIDHLKKVVRYLRPVPKTESPKNERTSRQTSGTKGSYEEEKRRCQERGDYLGAKIGIGAVIGATVGGVIVAAAGASFVGVIGGTVAGAAVGGAASALVFKGGKEE